MCSSDLSASDLYAALVAQCAEECVSPPPYAPVREVVSRGARAVLRCAFAERGEPALEALVSRYLQLYQDVMAQQTLAFDGIDNLLARIESHGLRWGIVTNKAAFLTDELVSRIGWAKRASKIGRAHV